MNSQLLSQARQLSVKDQLELAEALWNGIAERNAVPAPTDAQKAELDRRLADHKANPDDVVPWSEVKTSALPYRKMSLLVTFRRAARDEFIKATAWYEVRHPARSKGINCADLRGLIIHSPQPGPNHARSLKNQRPRFVLSLH